MKNKFIYITFIFLLFICWNCQDINKKTAREHAKAWKEAYKYRDSITDSTFLQTKRPMSDDAIGPYNYHTGFKEDRAYNQVVYIAALERAKKHLSVSGGELILSLSSGKDIHIAEDLFEYIADLIGEWNELVKKGLFDIIQTEDGYYDIGPIINPHSTDSISMIAGILQKQITNNPDWNPHAVNYGSQDWRDIPVINFVLGWKTEKDSITIWLAVHTEEIINRFSKEVIHSSFIRFRKSSPRTPLADHFSSTYKDGSSQGYELQLLQPTFTLPLPPTLTTTLFNHSDTDATTGTYYWIDYNNQGIWEVIDFQSNDHSVMVFADVGYSLSSHSKHEYTLSLYPDLYDYQPGEYRVRRGFLIDGHYIEKGQSRIWEHYFVAAPFTIKE